MNKVGVNNMKLNKKIAGITLVSVLIGSQVLASTELAQTFRNQFISWVADRSEIRQNTTRREILESANNGTKGYEAELAKQKEKILEELNQILEAQLEEGQDIDELLNAYQEALADEKVIQLEKVDADFKALLEEMNLKVEELVMTFEVGKVADAKAEIIKDKEQKIEEIKTSNLMAPSRIR